MSDKIQRAYTNIDLYMAKKGIKTDKELAKKLGLTQSKLSHRLRGKISLDTLGRCATLFNVSLKDMLRDD